MQSLFIINNYGEATIYKILDKINLVVSVRVLLNKMLFILHDREKNNNVHVN